MFPTPHPRALLLLPIALLSLALVACSDDAEGGELLEGTTFEVNREDGELEEVDSYDDVQEAAGFEVPVPFELPDQMEISRVVATPNTSKLGSLLQFFVDPEGTITESTLTVTQSAPDGFGEGSETDLGGTPGFFTESTADPDEEEQIVLQWRACDFWYALVSPSDLTVNDMEDIARAFIDACEE